MRKLGVPPTALRCTVNRFGPGPLIVRRLLIDNSALVSVIGEIPPAKSIVSPAAASRMACRSVPAPLSALLVTVRANAESGTTKRASKASEYRFTASLRRCSGQRRHGTTYCPDEWGLTVPHREVDVEG